MAIPRKPVPSTSAPSTEPDNAPGSLTRQDSWEIYSDDSDDDDDKAPPPAPQVNHTQSGSARTYTPYTPPSGRGDTTSSTPAANPAQSSSERTYTPYRPGGQTETNPFLRKKAEQESVAPPTEALSKLRTNDVAQNPWQQQALNRSGTMRSTSDYGTPPATSTSETNPWASKGPDRQYSPVPEFLDDSPNVTAPPVRLADPGSVWPAPQGPEATPATTNPWSDANRATDTSQPTRRPSTPPILYVPEESTGGPPSIKPPSPQPPPKISNPPPAQTFADVPSSSLKPRSRSSSPAGTYVASDDDSTWANISKDQANPDTSNAWAGLDAFDKPQDKGKERASEAQVEEWKLVDVGEGSKIVSDRSAQDPGAEGPVLQQSASGNSTRWVPPPLSVDAKTETYQIKKIKWHDATVSENPRTSPILIQNANGPCPLVALVNALSLTTPPDAGQASLVEVLRSREQISLNLLLDAVFEELMSPRRTNEDAALPDVGDLYAFLMSLHTGMNVNPRFIPSSDIREAYSRTSLTRLKPSERGNYIPGTFENTHEMSLYATFRIPLIHGWLPPADDIVYGALERQAQSYEDAQNLLFRQEELEMKLSNSKNGLNGQEQMLYQDIVTIQGFLESSATQLTPWGIKVISKAIMPGTFAILFRNDHFSTLYCHPQTMELVTLVTDEGYRSHEDLVWESLVDTSGRQTQYLSGDFKVVGHGGSSTFDGFGGGSSHDGTSEWTTVQNRRGGRNNQQSGPTSSAAAAAAAEPGLDAREQEDRDLALALQLQEEEDQRHREDEARREREQRLSSQYIEQQGRQPNGSSTSGTRASSGQGIAPQRRSSQGPATPYQRLSTATSPRMSTQQSQSSQSIRPLVPPRRSNLPSSTGAGAGAAGADAPPPPYEQAAHERPFQPPMGHPNHETSSTDSRPGASTSSLASGQGRPMLQSQRPAAAGPMFSRPQGGYVGRRERDRDCIVM